MVLLDADGELFRRSLEAVPDMIKPNREELEEYEKMDYKASVEETIVNIHWPRKISKTHQLYPLKMLIK